MEADAGVGGGGGGRRRRFGHEVEVEELERAHLDVLFRAAALEQARHGQESVEGFERAGVSRGVEQGGDEDEDGLGLHGAGVAGVKEVEEEVHVVLAVEEDAAGRVQEEDALEEREGGEDEGVGLRGRVLAHEGREGVEQAAGDCRSRSASASGRQAG